MWACFVWERSICMLASGLSQFNPGLLYIFNPTTFELIDKFPNLLNLIEKLLMRFSDDLK